MENLNKQNYPFVNEFEMNEQIMNEIALGIWNQRKTNNKIPLFLYLVVAIAPFIYGVLSGKNRIHTTFSNSYFYWFLCPTCLSCHICAQKQEKMASQNPSNPGKTRK